MNWQEYVMGALVALNLFQLGFWSIMVQRLVNKLMSRNFAEYNAIVNPPTMEIKEGITHREYEESREEQEILDELNGMIKT